MFFSRQSVRMKFAIPAALAVMAMAASPHPSQAAPPHVIRTIPNPSPGTQAHFGRNLMATSNGLIVTGSQFLDVGGVPAPDIAYVINGHTGAIVHALPQPEPQPHAGYGSFAWAGDTKVAVAAFFKNDGTISKAGRVYLFDLATGQYLRAIPNPTPGEDEQFGYGLAMMGETVIASARGDDTSGLDVGIVYLFDANTGALLKTLHDPEPTGQDNFGYSVAAANGKIFVGAPGKDTAGLTNSGGAYIFDASSGALLHKITPPTPAVEGNFGFQVRARGNDIIVGAPGQQRAYLFNGDTGARIATFVNPDIKPGAAMGSTVAAVGHHVLVGNPLDPFGDREWVGRAYIFNGNNGALMHILENPTGNAYDRFGVSVGALNGNIVIGADQATAGGVAQSGSLYILTGPQTEACDWTLYQ